MKRFYVLLTYRLEIVAGANISLPKGTLNLILLSPYEKAEKQPAKNCRAQALDCFVHNSHAFGGANTLLLHRLYPQSNHISN